MAGNGWSSLAGTVWVGMRFGEERVRVYSVGTKGGGGSEGGESRREDARRKNCGVGLKRRWLYLRSGKRPPGGRGREAWEESAFDSRGNTGATEAVWVRDFSFVFIFVLFGVGGQEESKLVMYLGFKDT